MKRHQIILEIICMLLFFLFSYAALSKLMDINKFRSTMELSDFLKTFSSWLPYAVIVVEFLVSFFLLWPKWQQQALYASFGLMALFTTYIIIILNSKNIPCSCGGILEQMTWNQHLLFNMFFLLLAFSGTILIKHNKIQNTRCNSKGL